ncbi:MAG: hypothetical protein IAG10_08475 [Planctomycetaceae bacterium]|nr:hypothetical protein [Planctomycetaceae bacterium]
MIELAVLAFAAIIGFLVRLLLKLQATNAWLIGVAVVPLFLVIAEFVWAPANLRYSGHIAGPVCLFLFFAGAAASRVGVFLAGVFLRGK